MPVFAADIHLPPGVRNSNDETYDSQLFEDMSWYHPYNSNISKVINPETKKYFLHFSEEFKKAEQLYQQQRLRYIKSRINFADVVCSEIYALNFDNDNTRKALVDMACRLVPFKLDLEWRQMAKDKLDKSTQVGPGFFIAVAVMIPFVMILGAYTEKTLNSRK